jgi:hypothetical protein
MPGRQVVELAEGKGKQRIGETARRAQALAASQEKAKHLELREGKVPG